MNQMMNQKTNMKIEEEEEDIKAECHTYKTIAHNFVEIP